MFRFNPPPRVQSLDELRRFVADEFNRLEVALQDIKELQMAPSFAEPGRKRLGLVVYADGVVWDPGSGPGLYVYDGTNWIQL